MNVTDLRCPSCGKGMRLTRAACTDCGITVEGNLEVSPLGKLSREEQQLVLALLFSGGNLTKTGEMFGISYPTMKNRLAALLEKLDAPPPPPKPQVGDLLDRLERGEIDARQALDLLA
ncbi:MAG: DUF2089 domain-containing protein [Candidatus Eisenbacteria bacterium]|jgi:hypothetical protein|nr:DUF2089 domain-containing protein [Candidatus Eisenbacteria bacterium]